jgi:hypothetical protein
MWQQFRQTPNRPVTWHARSPYPPIMIRKLR